MKQTKNANKRPEVHFEFIELSVFSILRICSFEAPQSLCKHLKGE